jgi:hypothetical protein
MFTVWAGSLARVAPAQTTHQSATIDPNNEEPAASENADGPCVLALERVLVHLAASAGII